MQTKDIQDKLETFLEKRRPPEELRDRLDVGYTFENRVVEIFQIRPIWNRPQEKQRIPVAKARYVVSADQWKVYWMRSNRKWTAYDPTPTVADIADFLALVDRDSLGCFWG